MTIASIFYDPNGDYSSVRVVGVAIGLATAFFLVALGVAAVIDVLKGISSGLQWVMGSAAAVVAAGSFGAANVLSKRSHGDPVIPP